MMTVHEVSRLTGVTIRALQYYSKIGLLAPTAYSESGYRLYDDSALETLQQILLFRELEFPLKDIKEILQSPSFDRNKALEQQIQLLTLKKEHLDDLIVLAREIQQAGGNPMEFQAFDKKKIDDYVKQAKEVWGSTSAYQEFEEKNKGRSPEQNHDLGSRMMALMADFGAMKAQPADAPQVQAKVKELQNFITANYYNCTKVILAQLGQMYADGGDFSANIDAAGGEGTAAFANEAIQVYCGR